MHRVLFASSQTTSKHTGLKLLSSHFCWSVAGLSSAGWFFWSHSCLWGQFTVARGLCFWRLNSASLSWGYEGNEATGPSISSKSSLSLFMRWWYRIPRMRRDAHKAYQELGLGLAQCYLPHVLLVKINRWEKDPILSIIIKK